ncbi:MAG: hypothetical protein EKK53_28320 [Burkholderiales bacterium]|nr:MAG: hypothetical protein EKK53_28320 [Burkholderiales bacterium]
MLDGHASTLTFVSLNFWLGRSGWVCRTHFGEVGRGASPDEAVSNWLKLNRNQLGLLRAAWTVLAEAGELPPHPPDDEPSDALLADAEVGRAASAAAAEMAATPGSTA